LGRTLDSRGDNFGAFFDAKPYAATAYDERTPLMREIRRYGVAL